MVCVCVCVCVYVRACVRARARGCVCDAHIIYSKLKVRGSTFLRSLQDISETMSPEFVRPRGQAIHEHTVSQLWGVEANSGAAMQAGPSTCVCGGAGEAGQALIFNGRRVVGVVAMASALCSATTTAIGSGGLLLSPFAWRS